MVAAGSQLGASHQLWQMNEINKLIWPSPDGIGDDRRRRLEPHRRHRAEHARTSRASTVLTAPADRRGLHQRHRDRRRYALVGSGVDTNGADFTPIEVTLSAGGN